MKVCITALLLLLVAFPALAYRQTNNQCVGSCVANGGMYSACMQSCADDVSIPGSRRFDPSLSQPISPAVNTQCISECREMGGRPAYCRQVCSR